MERTSASTRRINTIGAIVLSSALALGGLTACGSGSSDQQPDNPSDSPADGSDTTVLVKNKMLPTTTNVPSTLKMPTGPSGKPKRP